MFPNLYITLCERHNKIAHICLDLTIIGIFMVGFFMGLSVGIGAAIGW